MTLRATLTLLLLPGLWCLGCKHVDSGQADDVDVDPSKVVTPVTVTHPQMGNMTDTVEVSAVSAFLLKSYVKATANGYLEAVNAQLGKYVQKGEDLFVLQTKESRSLGNTVNALDTSLHFEGVIHIKAPGEGYVTQLTYRPGDYVQDGEQLAVISDARSFVFLLNLPYELKPFLRANRTLQLRLSDGTTLAGTVTEAMPNVDPGSQTQQYVVRVSTSQSIPENLIAKVSLNKAEKAHTISLPKSAVLSDDMQRQFWIMKMIDSTTAVKVMIQKGLETGDKVEILSPPLQASDQILLTGNYGLGDTAKVRVDNTSQ
jgi:multidrug efflux pump subunit AcrA (membrane-fusion protein)